MWLWKKTVWVAWGCKGPWGMDGELLIDLWVIFIITNNLTLNISWKKPNLFHFLYNRKAHLLNVFLFFLPDSLRPFILPSSIQCIFPCCALPGDPILIKPKMSFWVVGWDDCLKKTHGLCVCVCVCIHVGVGVSQRPGWFHDSTGHRRDNKLQQSSSWGPVMWGSVCVCIVCMCTLHWANKWLSVLKEISNFKIFHSKNWEICNFTPKFYVIIMQVSILVNKKLTQAMKK